MNALNLLAAHGVIVTIGAGEPLPFKGRTFHPLRLVLAKGKDRIEYGMNFADPTSFDVADVLQQLVYDSNAAQVPFEQWQHELPMRAARKMHQEAKLRGQTLAKMVDMAALTEAVTVRV